MIHHSEDGIELFTKEADLFVKCRKPMDIKCFNEIIVGLPRLQVTKFTALRDALIKATADEIHIGCYKPEIEIELSKDEMAAYLRLNMTTEAYAQQKDQVLSELLDLLKKQNITVGLFIDVLSAPLEVQKKIQIAAGVPSIPGTDAILKYFKFSEKKPELKTNGYVDHFEIHLIDAVEAGDWLGEKIPLTLGTEGMTVRGEPVEAKPGKDYALRFDQDTVEQCNMANGGAVIRARIPGAVTVVDQAIRVDNHMVIQGNVDYSTGNIDFDGYVTINGTIEDCFSVIAQKDVAVLDSMGVGAVALIESREGSVSIKGGVNGRGTAVIKAAKNIYLKYCSEANIDAGGMVQIGVYAYDANVSASKIELMKRGAKVVGGKMTAKHQVITGVIGNRFEKETKVQVLGFDRVQMKIEMENLQAYCETVVDRASKIRRQVEIFQLNLDQLDQKAINTYHIMQKELDKIVAEVGKIKEELVQMEAVLLIRGDGEVKILHQVYPKSCLEIKNHVKRVSDVLTGSFYVKDNEMHHAEM